MFIELIAKPEYHFLRLAFLLSAMSSITFGLIGSFVVVRRIGYLAGAISHCAFGGIGIGLWLKQTILLGGLGLSWLFAASASSSSDSPLTSRSDSNLLFQKISDAIDPVVIAIIVAIGAALLIGIIQKRFAEREDTIIGTIWSFGMAVGLLFLDRTEGYVSVASYLFGDIVLISNFDLWTVGILSVFVLLISGLCFKRLEAVCFDEEFARLRGINVDFYFRLLLILIAITVVLMLRIVGMILVIAMLTVPAATAARLTKRLIPMIVWSIFFCFIGSWIGIYLSLLFNFSVGPMIIVVISTIYAFVLVFFK
ncbi:MAG: metal ABC transporter permease [Planctomycetia bacterium]|nr:metal ABC transporter permease [Planctomycetia bacterium]